MKYLKGKLSPLLVIVLMAIKTADNTLNHGILLWEILHPELLLKLIVIANINVSNRNQLMNY